MSAVCVLTPILIGSWPAIASAIAAAASSLGFAVAGGKTRAEANADANSVETVLENSDILQSNVGDSQSMTIVREGVTVVLSRDERGICRVCVSGDKTKSALRKIGQEVAGRVMQQYAYSKLITELKSRNYAVVDEKVQGDQSIRVRVRMN